MNKIKMLISDEISLDAVIVSALVDKIKKDALKELEQMQSEFLFGKPENKKSLGIIIAAHKRVMER